MPVTYWGLINVSVKFCINIYIYTVRHSLMLSYKFIRHMFDIISTLSASVIIKGILAFSILMYITGFWRRDEKYNAFHL